ncbi:thiamine-phosphate kinase [Pseudoxanthomonas indica]|uniref:Thiamine-monophosphate kinase n=1 Tax=Pseudoxanthomonas indica TaxID=428993 RepID=A0A1T5LFW2_9GAMM|nr:thiamine-phosphate kinase [Pseudoxanthomonas indica]GGD34677.1 thiamine-monophosphate kinase [Pseudoxanthomonas indica]SKC74891.1 thiamine-phosphate kinase [Pseudoxanthomonas indica]
MIPPSGSGEFDLIARIRARVRDRGDVVVGIGDDAAVLQPPAGQQLAITTDTLNVGVHFFAETRARDLGWKALAVNLSDLAAMGAEPAWCTLSLSLPESDPAWLDEFIEGFLDLAGEQRIALVGGDTTRGPLSIAVTAIGCVDAGRALRRAGACLEDDVWVSGTLGDAAAALAPWPTPRDALRRRLERPQPRVALGRQLVGLAHAAADVSDGLLADLGHICRASGMGAEIWLPSLPASETLLALEANDRVAWQASGGDDYELCFTAASSQRDAIARLAKELDLPLTRIGRIVAGNEVVALDALGRPWRGERNGYAHF